MSTVRPPDTRPPLQFALSLKRVTHPPGWPYSPRVAREWPHEEFRDYLLALMEEKGISDYAELSRRSGVGQWQFSQWTRGLAQPSTKSLRKLAPALGVTPVKLFLVAGLNDAAELELGHEPDLRVGPAEFVALAELWEEDLSDDQRSFLRRSVATLVAGLRAELPKNARPARDRPSGGRRSA